MNRAGCDSSSCTDYAWTDTRALHTNLSVRFLDVRLLVAGDFGGRGLRLPDRVEVGGLSGCCNRIARHDGRLRCVRFPIPAEEVVAFSGRNRAGNGERYHAGVGLFSLRVGFRHIGDCVCRVFVVVQGVGLFGCIPCNIKLYWGIF